MNLVRENALKDPTYCPYCLGCSTMRRMRKLDHLRWCCDLCGTIADAFHDDEPLAWTGLPTRAEAEGV